MSTNRQAPQTSRTLSAKPPGGQPHETRNFRFLQDGGVGAWHDGDMPNFAAGSRSNVIPGLGYENASAMIEWLCGTFGFEKQVVYTGPDGRVMHAQLTFGNGMVMIGSAASGAAASETKSSAPYLIVTDCEAVYAKAKAAGAKILADLEEKPYGGKAFTCADPEGHIWHVGTYDPWDVAKG